MKLFKILVIVVVVGLAASGIAMAGDQLRDTDTDQTRLQQKDQLKDCDVSCDQTPDVIRDRDQLTTQDGLVVSATADESGDPVKARDRDRDGSCDGSATQDRTRTRARTQSQTCDGTCDQTQTQDADPDAGTQTQTQAGTQTQTQAGTQTQTQAGTQTQTGQPDDAARRLRRSWSRLGAAPAVAATEEAPPRRAAPVWLPLLPLRIRWAARNCRVHSR